MTPSNWAKYLSTNFKPEDLLNDPSVVRNQLYGAEKSRAMLLNRQNTLKSGQQDIVKLQTAEDTARRDLAQTQWDMALGYSDTVIKLVQLYFNAVTAKAQDPINAVKNIVTAEGVKEFNAALADKGLNVSPLTEKQFSDLQKLQASCIQKQANQQMSSEAFPRAQLALAQAKSEDGTNLMNQIQDQIDSLTMDIEYYKKVLATIPNPFDSDITRIGETTPIKKDSPENKVNIPTQPTLPQQSTGASVWQEIVLTYKSNEKASTNLSSTSVSHEGWQTGFWFWSASGTNDKSESTTSNNHSSKDTDIQIVFRVMKVSIQRPWMDTGILAKTKDFFRATDAKISNSKPSDTKTTLRTKSGMGSEHELLPSFATGFVVAKDVHIILSTQNGFDSSYVQNVQESSNSGGGFLCFSISKSKNSSENRQAAVVTIDGNHLSIKIAAPQIIGWISELTPEDQSVHLYNAFPQDEFGTAKKPDLQSLMSHEIPTPPPETH